MNVHFHPKRAALVLAASVTLVFLMVYNLVLDTGLIPGASPETDQRTASVTRIAKRRISVEGQIQDRNGTPITQPLGPGEGATLLYPEAYSHLIGFNSPVYGVSGLRRTLQDDLFNDKKDNIGADVTLTIDNALQNYCYSQLGDNEGSVIVMNAHTGALLACTSRSSPDIVYDINIVDNYDDRNGNGRFDEDSEERMYQIYAKYDAFFYNRSIYSADPSGSTFKIFTGAAMIENGLASYTMDDMDGTLRVGDGIVRNVETQNGIMALGRNVSMAQAMKYSSNVYFASGALQLGNTAMQNMAHRFLLDQPIELDFTTLEANFELVEGDAKLLADTGYGQGRLMVSPLHIVMMMSAVMNDGQMMKPYLVETVTNNGKTVRQATPEPAYPYTVNGDEKIYDETPTISSQTAEILKGHLHETALRYGLTPQNYGQIYAKTGTAELGIGQGNHIYVLAGIDNTVWGDLIVLIDRDHVQSDSGALLPAMKNILSYIATA